MNTNTNSFQCIKMIEKVTYRTSVVLLMCPLVPVIMHEGESGVKTRIVAIWPLQCRCKTIRQKHGSKFRRILALLLHWHKKLYFYEWISNSQADFYVLYVGNLPTLAYLWFSLIIIYTLSHYSVFPSFSFFLFD